MFRAVYRHALGAASRQARTRDCQSVDTTSRWGGLARNRVPPLHNGRPDFDGYPRLDNVAHDGGLCRCFCDHRTCAGGKRLVKCPGRLADSRTLQHRAKVFAHCSRDRSCSCVRTCLALVRGRQFHDGTRRFACDRPASRMCDKPRQSRRRDDNAQPAWVPLGLPYRILAALEFVATMYGSRLKASKLGLPRKRSDGFFRWVLERPSLGAALLIILACFPKRLP